MHSSRTPSFSSSSRLAAGFNQHVAVAIAACLLALILC
jgi:hypothetical protein